MSDVATTVVDRFLAAIEAGSISERADVWSDHAVLDATVPNWRFACAGVEAIRAEYGRWFADSAQFESLRRYVIDSGEVVEYTLTWLEHGVPHAGHYIHVLEVADDRIVADTVLCGGRWSAALLAEMEAAGG
jgi:hypothetical protein